MPSFLPPLRRPLARTLGASALVAVTTLLAACGSSDDSNTAPSPLSISGTLSGLSGEGLVLQNNGGDDLAVSANGSFTFPTAVASGGSYAVTVKTQPSIPAQQCTVASGSGTAHANVTSVLVNCVTPPHFAYVPNTNGPMGISAYQMDASTGALTPLAGGNAAATGFPRLFTVAPGGQFGYVINQSANAISAYAIDAVTGALTPFGSPVPTGQQPLSMVMTPDGKFAYVNNYNSATVSAFSLDPLTGLPSPLGTFSTGLLPRQVAMDPQGKHLYVLSQNGTVRTFAIGADGTLDTGTDTATGATTSAFLALAPNGSFLYVGNLSEASVSVLAVNATSGMLTLAAKANTGTILSYLTTDPRGKFLYGTNAASQAVSGYAIDATTGLPGAMVTSAPTGSNPASVAVDAGGKFAYVVNSVSQTVSAYSVASTGQLTPVLAPVATGSQPLYITLSGR